VETIFARGAGSDGGGDGIFLRPRFRIPRQTDIDTLIPRLTPGREAEPSADGREAGADSGVSERLDRLAQISEQGISILQRHTEILDAILNTITSMQQNDRHDAELNRFLDHLRSTEDMPSDWPEGMEIQRW